MTIPAFAPQSQPAEDGDVVGAFDVLFALGTMTASEQNRHMTRQSPDDHVQKTAKTGSVSECEDGEDNGGENG